jgi:hypothetical protein
MINIQLTDLNLLAIIVAWIVHVVMGLLWFSSLMFGKEWSKLTGQELKPATKWLLPGLIGHLAMAFILAVLIQLSQATTGLGGLLVGLFAWAGFIVPLEIGELVWEKIPVRLFLIRIGNHFIGLAVTGFILGAW